MRKKVSIKRSRISRGKWILFLKNVKYKTVKISNVIWFFMTQIEFQFLISFTLS